MPEAGPPPRGGAFVAVVGPSGAGKDTILGLAAVRLSSDPRIRFARRVITRQSQADAEDHDCLDDAGFAAAERGGAFCLTWEAHGLRYGLPSPLVGECRAGRIVIANVSRRALAEAAETFPTLHVVEITAPRALLVERIAARGRETAADIEARLSRRVALEMPAGAYGPHRIDNSGPAQEAAARFVALVEGLLDRTEAAA